MFVFFAVKPCDLRAGWGTPHLSAMLSVTCGVAVYLNFVFLLRLFGIHKILAFKLSNVKFSQTKF